MIGPGVLSLYCKEKQLEDGGKGLAKKTAKSLKPTSTRKIGSEKVSIGCLCSRGMGINDVGDGLKRRLPGSMSRFLSTSG